MADDKTPTPTTPPAPPAPVDLSSAYGTTGTFLTPPPGQTAIGPSDTTSVESRGAGNVISDVSGRIWNAIKEGIPAFNSKFEAASKTDTGKLTSGETPKMQLVTPEAAMSPVERKQHPIATGVGESLGALTSPDNVAIAAGTGGFGELPGAAGKLIPKLVSLGFSAQSIKGAYDQLPDFKKALDKGDASEAERIITHIVMDTAIGAAAGQHATEGAGEHIAETAKTFAKSIAEEGKAAVNAKAPEGSLEAGFAKLGGKKVGQAIGKPDAARDAVEAAGGTFRGKSADGLVEITLPRAMTDKLPIDDKFKDFVSVTMPEKSVTPDAVKAAMDKKFSEMGGKPEAVSAPAAAPEMHPALKAISDKYSTEPVSDSSKYEPSFIRPDGKAVYLGATFHPDAINSVPEGKVYGDTEEGRTKFINDTGAIRVRPNMSQREGQTFHFTVPENGVTEAQVDALRKTAATIGGRGNLMFETASKPNELRSNMQRPEDWQYKGAHDVEPILGKIGVLPGQKVNLSEAYGETGRHLGAVKPTEVKPQGTTFLSDAANKYNEENGLPPIKPEAVQPDPREQEIADAYKKAVHSPNDPAVKKSYDALKQDIDKQYDLAQRLGIKMDVRPDNPYGLSTTIPAHEELHNDILNNKHLSVWSGGAPPADHPLSAIDPKTGLTYNDKFRMVHDIFGHAKEKVDFSPAGEESAWQQHRQMFSKEAQPALATETRGQAAYTYKYGDFPPQKAAILPEQYQVRPEDIQKKTAPWAAKAAETAKAQGGGFTIDPRTGESPTKGYQVETATEIRPKPLDHPATAADIQKFYEDNKAVFDKHPELQIGGYKNELNASVNTPNRAAAIALGKKLDQISVWDHAKGEEIPTGGKSEKTSFPDYPLEQRLKDLKGGTTWTPPTGLEKGIPKSEAVSTKIPLDKISVSEKAYNGALSDNSKGRGSKTKGPVSLFYNPDNGQYLVEDGMHRVVEAHQNGEESIPAKIWSGYSDSIANVRSENRMDLSKIEDEDEKTPESPKSPLSTVPLLENPLKVPNTKAGETPLTIDVAKALNKFSKNAAGRAELNETEPAEMVKRAASAMEDEAKYQLAQNNTGEHWYTTEIADHDASLQDIRPELKDPEKLSLFKMAEAVLSSGQKPYRNVKSAVMAWDAYKNTGKFPEVNPETGKSWGPRGIKAYGNAMDYINRLVSEKGEQGASEWLLGKHPVSDLRQYNKDVKGKMTDERYGTVILGDKRGPFAQNLHGIESEFTADMWVSRTWNRLMGTMEFDPESGEITTDHPRNQTERKLMKESFEHLATKLGKSTSSAQAVMWYYEQALYRAHGVPKESWSFSDAAKRVQEEDKYGTSSVRAGDNEGKHGGQSNLEFGSPQEKKDGNGFKELSPWLAALIKPGANRFLK